MSDIRGLRSVFFTEGNKGNKEGIVVISRRCPMSKAEEKFSGIEESGAGKGQRAEGKDRCRMSEVGRRGGY